jgi:hypothetical protein
MIEQLLSDIYNINKTTLVTSQIYILYYNTMSIHTCCNISNYILAFASFLLHKFYLWIKHIFEIEFLWSQKKYDKRHQMN